MAEYSKELSYIKFERYDDTVKLVKDIVRIFEKIVSYYDKLENTVLSGWM